MAIQCSKGIRKCTFFTLFHELLNVCCEWKGGLLVKKGQIPYGEQQLLWWEERLWKPPAAPLLHPCSGDEGMQRLPLLVPLFSHSLCLFSSLFLGQGLNCCTLTSLAMISFTPFLSFTLSSLGEIYFTVCSGLGPLACPRTKALF